MSLTPKIIGKNLKFPAELSRPHLKMDGHSVGRAVVKGEIGKNQRKFVLMISKHTCYKFESYQPFKPNLTEELVQFPNIGFVTPQSPSNILRNIMKYYSPTPKIIYAHLNSKI